MTHRLLTRIQLGTVLGVSLALTVACTKTHTPAACKALDPEYFAESKDSFESYNRAVFEFNTKFDAFVVEGTARFYRKNVPQPARTGVSNFFKNLKEPRNFFAATLMAKPEGMANASLRFAVNTVFGLGGIIDIAEPGGMAYMDYDFGQAMGYWGVPSGPHLEVPFVGPATPRSLVGSGIHNRHTYLIDRIKKSEHQLLVQNQQLLDSRANLLPFTDIVKEQADPYIFVRETYRQNRLAKICLP